MSERFRILVLGRSGQLASALSALLDEQAGWCAAVGGRPELDVTDSSALRKAVDAFKPQVIVNASAYTAVDRAEQDRAAAFAVNRDAVAVLAAAAERIDAAVVHVSTDYVFDGLASRPYLEEDSTNPQGVYGTSKLAGEQALTAGCSRHVILRTSWLYGARGQNFLRSMLRLGSQRERLSVVDDQRGCPTAVPELAAAILVILRAIAEGRCTWGIYHYGGVGGPVSWYDFAEEIFRQARNYGYPAPALSRTTTEAFGAPAPRPAYSLLDCGKIERTFGVTRRDWRLVLAEVLAEVAKEQAHKDKNEGNLQ